jgi:hypothetical protein
MTKDEAKRKFTPEQVKSMDRLIAHYKKEPEQIEKAFCCDVMILNFGFIWIGIETDGYSHS